jgi:O-acetyl-ADP-ribose deacetylase (regulator of RNase III)
METVHTYHQGRLVIAVGDITHFDGDAIVNAANSTLLGGGGVDGAIHRAAGPGLLAECRVLRATSLRDGLPTGKAVGTGAGRLSVKGIIHTVGPVWSGGSSDTTRAESALLASAYRESLSVASEHGWHRVAFPAISTGVYGYPKQAAAIIAFDTITAWLMSNALPLAVWLVFFSPGDAEIFTAAVASSRSPDRL